MKNLLLTLILIVVCTLTGYTQRYNTAFGKIGKEELDLKVYDKDTSAEAVILFDIGDSRFVNTGNGFEIIFEQTKRIKILKEAGISYAEIEIPFYREGSVFEKITELEAYTYNFENLQLTKTALDESSTHDEKVNDYWMVKKFAMPNVKEGSIIEYKYKLSTQYLFNIKDWTFQDKIPTIYSQYTARMIPFYEYVYLLQGASEFDSQNTYLENGLKKRLGTIEYNDYVHEFVMKDVPAFKSESYITSINDYILKLDFQLAQINYPDGRKEEIITTWPELIEELDNHADFGKYVKKCEKLAAKTIDVNALKAKPKKERFEEVVNYVKHNFKWNEYYARYASKSPSNLLDDKYGNVADLNLLTIGFLNAVDIEAYPVLISTRKNGKIKFDYPYLNYFNYVLIYAQLDDENVISDATELYYSPYRIPERCINERGLLIRQDQDENVKWIGLQSSLPTETNTSIKMHFEDDLIKTSVEIAANEYEAISFKEDIGDDSEQLLNYLKEKNYDVELENLSITTHEDYNQFYTFKFEPNIDADIINDKIYISPFLNETSQDNPLTQETRTYPVDMIYPWKDSYSTVIEIPEGYEVDFVPENYKVKNNLFEMEYTVNKTDKTLEITFYCYFKNAEYPAKEYSKIKYFMNQIVKKGNEKVVLVKV